MGYIKKAQCQTSEIRNPKSEIKIPHLFLFPNKKEDKLVGKTCRAGIQDFRDGFQYLTIEK